MEVSKSKDYRMTFSINERKLRELENIMIEVSEKIDYRVYCIDGTTMTFEKLDDFIKYPNRKEKQYRQIEISNNYGSPVRISVTLVNSEYRSASYRVTADERTVDYYSSKIEGFLMSLKQWYSNLGAPTMLVSLVTFAILYTAILLLLIAINVIESASSLYVSLPIALLILFTYDKTRYYLFPVATFELGDGIDRAKNRNFVRNLILVGIVLSGVVGYVVNQFPGIER
jgi:hypothetical protein